MEELETKSLVSILQRALFYESQYRNALVSDAISYYDCNLSKDLIETDIFFKNEEGEFCSSLELVGLTAPCKFSEFLNRWIKKFIHPEYITKYPFLTDVRKELLLSFELGQRDFIIEYWYHSPLGKKLFLNQRYLLTQNESGDICALSIVKNETRSRTEEDKLHREELEQYAFYDPITHGYNYIKFKRELDLFSQEGSIVAIDIHDFKVINSICGISVGDSVISRIWQVITDSLDFKHHDMAGHINADHFIAFINTFDQEEIITKLKSISFALKFISAEMSIPVVLPYFGVSKWIPGKKIELAYSEAIAAKKKAKDQQNINYSFFEEKDNIRLIRDKMILDSFETALANKEFKIWYQPKYNPYNHTLVGAEGLVRWIRNGKIFVSPADFIPLLERNGLIMKFDEYIFRNVCLQQKKWRDAGKHLVPVSINLSRLSLYYENVVSEYKKISEDIGIEKDLLPIEITETAAVTNNEIEDIADKFYKAGFILHMDDFGSGYSSLATLNTMHFDTLKLDKSLIDYIGNFGGERLIEHTILLAKELGIHITAEGVETEQQVRFLRQIGCDSIQGYFYSKPIKPEKFELLLDEIKAEKNLPDYDFLNNHINAFKNSFTRTPLYTFVCNLTENTFYENTGSSNWMAETTIEGNNYEDCVNALAEKNISPGYREAYLDFMDRKKNIESYKNVDITRIFQYKRSYYGEEVIMRMITDTFKVDDSDDIWMYISVTMY